MQKLKLTVESLENDSKEMEERLQQLKEHMSKEKEERGLSRGFKWASGQHIPFNSNYPANKKKNENVIYKSQQQTGKVRIRVLKRESFTDLLQPPPPRSVGQLTVRRNRVKETICGPCEVKTAGLVLMVSDEEEKDMEVIETAVRRQPSCLLDGNFSEEESARYFQEALKQWRRERRDGKVQPMDATLTLQSAMATQVDLLPDRKAEKRRGGEEETPTVSVQFTQNKLTYMDRLLLKKHRRTPTENPTPLLNDETKLKLLPDEDPEEDAVCTFTAEEEDLHIYFASLFAPPDSSSRTKPQIVAPEPCFVIQILDETNIDTTRECVQEQKTDNRMVSLVHQISETSLKSSDSESAQSSSTKQPFKAVTPTQHKTGRKLNPTQLQDVAFEYSKSHISEDRLLPLTPGSFPLRSTFTVSPPSSTESALLPNIFFPSPQTKSESYVFQELASPTKLLEAPRDKLMSPRHVKQFKSGPENQLLEDQLTHVPCMPAGIDPTPTTLEPVRSITGPVPCPLHKQYFPKSIPRYGESPLCTSSTHISDDLKTNQSSQNTDFIASPLLNIGANTVKMEEELEPSADSGDELSSDSLSLALFEEDSSGVETQIQGHLTTKKLKEKQSSASCFQEDSFIPAEPEKEKDLLTDKPERLMASFHSPFSSVPPSVSMSPQVMQSQSVGTGSQHFCDLNGFSPLGLDVDTCYTHSPEQPFCSRQSSLHDLNPTVSFLRRCFWWPSLAKDAREFVSACTIYAQNKVSNRPPAGLLHPLPVPSRPWSHIALDFVTGLPSSSGKTAIMTIVDRFSKAAHFVPLSKLPSAVETAKLVIEHVFRLHGIPVDIVSDRGPQFISQLWKTFCAAFGPTVSLSSGFHPQSNGQAEKTNQDLKVALPRRGPGSRHRGCWTRTCSGSSTAAILTSPVVRPEAPLEGGVLSGTGVQGG